jgi:hypothetical protein
MSGFIPEKQAQASALGMTLAEKVRGFYKNEQHRKEFELWYKQKYGKPYQWKKVKV